MLKKALNKIATVLLRYDLPIFFVFMFVLAEIPILPLRDLLGRAAVLLNVFAVMAVAVAIHLALIRKDAVHYFILGKRLGLDVESHDNAAEFFERPFVAWFWLLLDFALLWLIVVMATGSILYNLAAVSRLYNPFQGDVTLVSVFLFVLDQAFKGMFFDIMEVFNLNVPSELEFKAGDAPILGGILVAFRMAITISFVQLFMLYLGIYSQSQDPRLMRLAVEATERKRRS